MLPEDALAAAGEAATDDIVDAVFAITCRNLPVDHAWALSQAVEDALPWFAGEPAAGLHTVHGAASGSGWMRPEGEDALLALSHRARLALRLPRRRLDDAADLVGQTLQVAGWPLRVDRLAVRALSRITTLYARSVVFAGFLGEEDATMASDDEPAFLAAAAGELQSLGIQPATLLCGRVTPVATPAGAYLTRSLMLAGLTAAQALTLQRRGLGGERRRGCGVFIPHKDIGNLNPRTD